MNFQIKQCEIKIEYLFFAVIAFLLFTDTTGVALLGIAATVLHEAGHLVMMLLLGSSVKTVRFHAFGVDIEETGRGRRSYLSDALVALAGPFDFLCGIGSIIFFLAQPFGLGIYFC